jgi:hypothetical protein
MVDALNAIHLFQENLRHNMIISIISFCCGKVKFSKVSSERHEESNDFNRLETL